MTLIVEAKILIRMGNQKITAIKGLRAFSGMGLVEAKNFVEQREDQTHTVRMTVEQLGMAMLVQTEWNDLASTGGTHGTTIAPRLDLWDIKRVQPEADFIDFSAN